MYYKIVVEQKRKSPSVTAKWEGNFVGRSRQTESLIENIAIFGPTDESILIVGETGTGKELVAKSLFQASGRSNKRYSQINCNDFVGNEELMSSELFGHAAGAFTGATKARRGILEAARNGTVFLDEIGDLSPYIQGKLLRAVEEKKIRRLGESRVRDIECRIIAATNKPETGPHGTIFGLRPDLRYRFGAVICTSPLRERPEDILELFEHFVSRDFGQNATPEAIGFADAHCLFNYDWPGNVRELKSRVKEWMLRRKRNENRSELEQHWIFLAEDAYQSHGCWKSEKWHETTFYSSPIAWQLSIKIPVAELRRLRDNYVDEILFMDRNSLLEQINAYLISKVKVFEKSTSLDVEGFPPNSITTLLSTMNYYSAKMADVEDQFADLTKPKLDLSKFTANFDETAVDLMSRYVKSLIAHFGGSQTRATKSLNINERTLIKWRDRKSRQIRLP